MKPLRAPLRWCGALAAAVIALAALGAAAQEARQAPEYRVKAAFVYKFGDYVDWPEQSFAAADSPLRIGVVEAEPLARELEALVQGRTMAGRRVEILRRGADEDLAGLHLVYLGDAAAAPLDRLLAAAGRPGVLTVTEAARGGRGSVINFVLVDAKVRFDVDLRSAESQELRISARLLSVARRVERRR